MLFVLLSALLVNMLHFYLLWNQRGNRQPTISEHAIKNRFTKQLYAAVHILSNIFLALYGWQVFHHSYHNEWMFGLMILSVILNSLQAVFPVYGKYGRVHYYSAFGTLLSLVTFCVVAPFLLPLSTAKTIITSLMAAFLLLSFIYFTKEREGNRKYFWLVQTIDVFIVYAELLLLVR